MEWEDVKLYTDMKDTKSAYNCFHTTYKSQFDLCFPEKVVKYFKRSTPDKEWMSSGLVRCCNKKLRLYNHYLKCPTQIKKLKYIEYRNKLKIVLRKAEKHFYALKFSEYINDLRQTWKLLNTIIKKTPVLDTIDYINLNGVKVTDRHILAKAFNEYFVGIGETLAKSIPKMDAARDHTSYLLNPSVNSMAWVETDAKEIESIVNKLPNKQSAGHDSLPVHIIKLSVDKISKPLSWFINSSFATGCVPDNLKIAKICPVFKSGDAEAITNYRLISILPTFSKILERAIFNRLHSFLNFKNTLTSSQYGFPTMSLNFNGIT